MKTLPQSYYESLQKCNVKSKELSDGKDRLDGFHANQISLGLHITSIGTNSAFKLGGIAGNTSDFSFTFFRHLICEYDILICKAKVVTVS
jgi:hypothetical protein